MRIKILAFRTEIENESESESHLSELSKNFMYKAVMANQKAQELDPEITVHEK